MPKFISINSRLPEHKTLNICTINAIYWVGYIIEGAASVKWTPLLSFVLPFASSYAAVWRLFSLRAGRSRERR